MSNEEIDSEIGTILNYNVIKVKENIEKKYGVKIFIDLSWGYLKNEENKNMEAM